MINLERDEMRAAACLFAYKCICKGCYNFERSYYDKIGYDDVFTRIRLLGLYFPNSDYRCDCGDENCNVLAVVSKDITDRILVPACIIAKRNSIDAVAMYESFNSVNNDLLYLIDYRSLELLFCENCISTEQFLQYSVILLRGDMSFNDDEMKLVKYINSIFLKTVNQFQGQDVDEILQSRSNSIFIFGRHIKSPNEYFTYKRDWKPYSTYGDLL